MSARGQRSASQKPKAQSPLVKYYVVLYNTVLFFGWSYVLVRLAQFFLDGHHVGTTQGVPLWSYLRDPLLLFQSAALLEIVHAITGVVRSPLMTTLMQVASRLLLTWGIANIAPIAQNHYFLASMVAAWGITEIIRYSYYAFNTLNGHAPYFLLWLRYTLFYVLYPLGVASEIGLIIVSLSWVRETDVFSFHMPNKWNFAFDYHTVLIIAILSYLPGFPTLFMHMVTQRKKCLGTPAPTKKH
ncbi:tyrosine phosphatase, putative [Acanthamoeba castellanii str. Neff]|uniref:very-long-chain (3R)-3-hydroxyacyl-CoA dehydratase n=1 Tax=Acanthamoeba castellanii (strain ATCC 30010 / Neff) TaxID=1257118 RepID=L8HG36_ACACF|nr:tyrosine phosphatase, putative [Acanthamoeba castellanii str. Neff]ELR23688.1 tyrosine phosphatase, putative [Acanthamoeba castellanii str. Neff]